MIGQIAQHIFEKYNFWIFVFIILIGLYSTIASGNLLKKLIGLSIFQTGIFLFYVSLGDVGNLANLGLKTATPPILWEEAIKKGYAYANPLPHVLMLTGIVVSAATTGVALALVVRMFRESGTIEEDEIIEKEKEMLNKQGEKF
jgi:multicomponent Na+:H+ antiporter subunit C